MPIDKILQVVSNASETIDTSSLAAAVNILHTAAEADAVKDILHPEEPTITVNVQC